MNQVLNRRSLWTVGAAAGIYTLGMLATIPGWGMLAWILSAFQQHTSLWLLVLSFMLCLARKAVLKQPARVLTIPFFSFLSYLFVFQTVWLRWVKAQPSFFVVWTYLLVLITYFLLGHEMFWQTLERQAEKWGKARKYPVLFLLLLAAQALVLFLAWPAALNNLAAPLLTRYYFWLLLLLLATALIRKYWFKKQPAFLKGLVVYFIFTTFLAWLTRNYQREWIWIFLVWYSAGWAHVFLEEIFKTALPQESLAGRKQAAVKTKPNFWDKGLGLKLSKTFDRAKAKLPAVWPNLKRAWHASLGFVVSRKMLLLGIIVGIGLLSAGAWGLMKLYDNYYVRILSFEPRGQVEDRVAVRITFSDAVKPAPGAAAGIQCFSIEPNLAGTYRQENDRTIVFVPDHPLQPSSAYTVAFKPETLRGVHKHMHFGAEIQFNTEAFQANGATLFYNVDELSGGEMEVVGQVDFNYPVSPADLRAKTRIYVNDAEAQFELEKSMSPTRFYIKGLAVKPQDKDQRVRLVVAKDLGCLGGMLPLGAVFQKDLILPAKPKLEVREVKLWHEPGTTFVSVMFNMPVSKEQVEKFVTITPEITWHAETEYACAVLKGEFAPNTEYQIKILKGLVAKSGEVLEENRQETIFIQDIPAQVKFARRGHILSLAGPKTIAISTINLDSAHVEIRKVFRNNLAKFVQSPEEQSMTHPVFEGDFEVTEGKLNQEVPQYIDLTAFNAQPYQGLFQIRLSDPRESYRSDFAWFLCTDLGLIAKRSGDDLWVYVSSIETQAPKAGATVELISDDNQVMDHQVADDSGKVVFSNWQKHEYKLRPCFVVARQANDFSFLYFEWSELNQFQFSVGGDTHANRLAEAFITPERGVYRPGEKAYITAIVRAGDNTVPPDVPVELRVQDPRGADFKRLTGRYNSNGLVCFEVPFQGGALTGQYYLRLYQAGQEEPLGISSLKVEEFIPDKLKVEVAAPAVSQPAGKPFLFKVKARQLFGPPAAGSKVASSVRFYSRIFSHPDYEGYVFGDANRSFADEEVDLGQDKLDEHGEKTYSLEIPRLRPPSALRAYIYTEVFDSGGREVSASGYGDIDVYSCYVGLRLEGAAPYLIRQPIAVNWAAIDAAGKKQRAGKARLVVKRKSWYSIFRQGSWGKPDYQSAFYEEVISKKEIILSGAGSFQFTPDKAGEYQVILASPEGMQSSVSVSVLGPGYEVGSLESPEKLKIVPDKKEYAPGETANLFIQAPFAGKLYLSLERDKVYFTRMVELAELETTLSLPVAAEYLPNVYAVGLLVRKPTETKENLPMVSFGIEPLAVKTSSKAIGLDWNMEQKVKSKDGIDVELNMAAAGGRTHLVLAAVDEGILQITNFPTPNPLDYFYRKRSLTTKTYSIFDFLLPDLWKRKAAIGGGDGGDISRRHLNPIAAKKPKSLALFSGILSPDSEGKVKYHFDTSDFNGEVRVMALAVQNDHFGSGARNVMVSDPIVLQLNTPRAVAPLDQFHIPVEIFNQTGKKAEFTLGLKAEGPVDLTGTNTPKPFTLEPGGQKRVLFYLTAKNNAGVAKFKVTAAGGGERMEKSAELAVRPVHTLKSVVEHGVLQPQGTAVIQVPAGFIPHGQRLRCALSSNPLFRHLQSLEYLIAYPYGCAEQTTSRIFPLLYFKDLGLATGLFTGQANAIDRFVQDGIEKLEKQQLPNGEFSMWPGGSPGGRWITCYVSHCLLEAKTQGYRVQPEVLGKIREYIRRTSPHLAADEPKSRLDRRNQGPKQDENIDPYILYLKTLINEADKESMSYLATSKLDKLPEIDRAILSMCYSQLGDTAMARKILKPDWKSLFVFREQYGAYNSSVRNTALYLSALAQAEPTSPKIPAIIKYLVGQMNEGRFGTTQENAWAFMALGRVYGSETRPVSAELLVNGAPYKKLSGKDPAIEDKALSGKKLTLKNLGTEPAYYYFLAEGTPLSRKTKPSSQGLKLSRTYRDVQGRSLNLGNVAQGQMVIVTLDLQSQKDTVRNVVLVDILPAGFEIENPRLQSRGQLGFDPAMSMNIAYQDIRDDRILIFCDELNGAQSFSYAVRAVTPGKFVIPDALAEAMYDPEIHALYGETATLNIADNNE